MLKFILMDWKATRQVKPLAKRIKQFIIWAWDDFKFVVIEGGKVHLDVCKEEHDDED